MPKSFIGNNGHQYRFEKDITQEEFDSYYAREVGNESVTKTTTESAPQQQTNKPVTFKDKALVTFLNSVISTLPSNSKYYDDPTTMGFTLFFEFEGRNSPLFNESNDGESAIRYLKNIGENKRAAHLKRFKQRLYDVTKFYPYFYQKVKGLEGLYKLEPGKPLEPKILTIETLESIDLRIGSLASEYMDAFYDFAYKREMIPINLIRFKCHILVSEIRKFRTYVGQNNTTNSETDEMNMVQLNDFLSYYWLTFNECNFDFGDSLPFLGDLSTSTPGTADNTFKIIAPNFIPRNKMKLLDLYNPTIDNDKPTVVSDTRIGVEELENEEESNDDGTPKTKKDKIKDALKKYGKQELDDLKKTGLSVFNGVAQTAGTALESKANEFLQKYDPIANAKQLAFKGLDYLDSYLKNSLFGAEINNPTPETRNTLGTNSIINDITPKNDLSAINTDNQSPIHELSDIGIKNPSVNDKDLSGIVVNNQDITKTLDDTQVNNNPPNKNLDTINVDNQPVNKILDDLSVNNVVPNKNLSDVDTKNQVTSKELESIDVKNIDDSQMTIPSLTVNNNLDSQITRPIVTTKNNIIPDNINLDLNIGNPGSNVILDKSVNGNSEISGLADKKLDVKNTIDGKELKSVDTNNNPEKQEQFKDIEQNEKKFSKFDGFIDVNNKQDNKKIESIKDNENPKEKELGQKHINVDNDLVKLMKDQLKDFNERPVTAIIDETLRSNLGNIVTNNKIVE